MNLTTDDRLVPAYREDGPAGRFPAPAACSLLLHATIVAGLCVVLQRAPTVPDTPAAVAVEVVTRTDLATADRSAPRPASSHVSAAEAPPPAPPSPAAPATAVPTPSRPLPAMPTAAPAPPLDLPDIAHPVAPPPSASRENAAALPQLAAPLPAALAEPVPIPSRPLPPPPTAAPAPPSELPDIAHPDLLPPAQPKALALPAKPRHKPAAPRPKAVATARLPMPEQPSTTASSRQAMAPGAAPASTSRNSSPAAQASAAPAAALVPPRPLGEASDNPPPSYPERARMRREEGRVVLNVRVSADGRALAVAVDESSGHDDLDQAAMAAVSRWRFIPASQAGKPCAAAALVPILFRLED